MASFYSSHSRSYSLEQFCDKVKLLLFVSHSFLDPCHFWTITTMLVVTHVEEWPWLKPVTQLKFGSSWAFFLN